jgi:hypothetical protein
MTRCLNKFTETMVFAMFLSILPQCILGQSTDFDTGNKTTCFSTESLLGNAQTDLPILAANGGNLTCYDSIVELTGTSSISDASFWWKSPYSSTLHIGATFSTSKAGYYDFFVKNNQNGCIAHKKVLVTDGRVYPKVSTIGGQIDCNSLETTLHTAAIPHNIIFQWSGPDGFSADYASPTVDGAGLYILRATEPHSGCQSIDSAFVTVNQTLPFAQCTVSEELNCHRKKVWLSAHGSSLSKNIQLMWWSANGFSISPYDSTFAQVSEADVYSLMVTNIENGCTASASVEVKENINLSNSSLYKVFLPSYWKEQNTNNNTKNDKKTIKSIKKASSYSPILFSQNDLNFNKKSNVTQPLCLECKKNDVNKE